MALALSEKHVLGRNQNKIYLRVADSRNPSNGRKVIHPILGIALALCDGTRTFEQLVSDLSYSLGVSSEQADVFLRNFTKENPNVVVESDQPNSRFNPLDFVVPADKIDLRPDDWDAPFSVVYIPTFRCSRRCLYCYADRNHQSDSTPLARSLSIIEEMKDIGVAIIQFSGGDPFMLKEFPAILRHALKHKIDCFVSTKTVLQDRIIADLAAMGCPGIQVSVDSADPAVADRLAGSSGYLEEMIPVIQKLISSGISVTTNTVITPINVSGLPTLIDLLANMGIKEMGFAPYGRSYYHHQDFLFLSDNDRMALDEAVSCARLKYPNIGFFVGKNLEPSKLTEKQRSEVFVDRVRCSAGREAVVILPDGKVQLCEQLPPSDERFIVGDLMSQTLAEVWHSQRMRDSCYPSQASFPNTVCHSCQQFDDCHQRGWCFRNALFAYNSPYAPDPLCPRAPIGRRLA